MWVRSDRQLVRIYRDGEQVKMHPRQAPGGRSTDYDDYPKDKSAYAMRHPQRLIDEAEAHGVELGRFMRTLLAGPTPWAKLRQAQKLVRLGGKYGWARLDAACARANAFGLENVRRVETILLQHLDPPAEEAKPDSASPAEQPALRFQRPASAFTHPSGEKP